MAENKLRKKYRDKFLKGLGMHAGEIPNFSTAEEYEAYYEEMKFRQKDLGNFGYFGYGDPNDFEDNEAYSPYPDEMYIAEEKLTSFFKKHYNRRAGEAEEGYENLGKLYRQYYDIPKAKRKKLLANTPYEAIDAIEGIVKYKPGHERHEGGIFMMQRILTGGEVPTMEEAYELAKRYGNIDEEDYE